VSRLSCCLLAEMCASAAADSDCLVYCIDGGFVGVDCRDSVSGMGR